MPQSPIQFALNSLVDRIDLPAPQMEAAMRQVMQGEASQIQLAAFLAALRPSRGSSKRSSEPGSQ